MFCFNLLGADNINQLWCFESLAYKGIFEDIRTIAASLDVEFVVEGSFRRAGNRIRISAALIDGNTGKQRCVGDLTAVELACASAVAKMVASSVTYPHEVIRSHMHVQGLGPFGGVLGLIAKIHAEGGGLRAFYRGVGTNLVRTTPAAAITFTSYELISRQFQELGRAVREEEDR